MDWSKKWLVDFNAGKTLLVLFDQSNNTGFTDVKLDWSVSEEKSSFKMLESTFSSKLDWGSSITCIAKTVSKKIRALITHSMKFLSPEVVLYLISVNLPSAFVWNTVVTFGLVPLGATWNC